MKVWDAATRQETLNLKAIGGVRSVAFSPDGWRIAAGARSQTVTVWDARPLEAEPAKSQIPSEADRLVRTLFSELFLTEYVQNSIRAQTNLSEPVRAQALALAERYPVDAQHLNDMSWKVASRTGRDPADYLRAVRVAEAACRVDPFNGLFLNTMGVARYRAGQYREALADLNRSLTLNAGSFGGPIPADMAFIAMAQHRLGQAAEARTTLERLREVMKKGQWSTDLESKSFLDEAAALIDRQAGAEADLKPSGKK